MQEVKIYVSAAEAVGAVRDYANAKNAAAPALVRGIETMLKLRLFGSANDLTPYPIDQLSNIAAWKFVMDADYDPASNYKIQADNENITVSSVTDNETPYTEVSIPLLETNTEELAEWLGTSKSKNGLTAELVGFNGDGDAIFVLQIENFSIRNRLTSAGDPTPIEPEYLSEAQVRALINEALAGGGGGGSGMTEAEVIAIVDQRVEAKFEELANAEW
jgi:hypothetical protein